MRNEATRTFYRAGGFRDYTVQLVKPLDTDDRETDRRGGKPAKT